MSDPTKYRRIADHHIERLIHKYNPADQIFFQNFKNQRYIKKIEQENINYWMSRLTPALTALIDVF